MVSPRQAKRYLLTRSGRNPACDADKAVPVAGRRTEGETRRDNRKSWEGTRRRVDRRTRRGTHGTYPREGRGGEKKKKKTRRKGIFLKEKEEKHLLLFRVQSR